MAWLLQDIRQFLADQNSQDTSAKAYRQYDRMANDANRALHAAGDWRFDRTRLRVYFDARKNGGTVSVNSDGTAVTGSSTSFATGTAPTGDVGKFFRFNGEAHQYRVSAYVSATALTLGDTYRGASNLSAVTYQLTHDRVQLDSSNLVRKLALPDGDDGVDELWPVTLEELMWHRLHGREVSDPQVCAIEDFTTSTVGAAQDMYLWVYPSPLNREILDIPVYKWPMEMATASTDGISAPAQAEAPYRAFLEAFLLLNKGKHQEYDNQLKIANGLARSMLASFRAQSEGGTREPWTPGSDPFYGGPIRRRRILPAPGEPVHE